MALLSNNKVNEEQVAQQKLRSRSSSIETKTTLEHKGKATEGDPILAVTSINNSTRPVNNEEKYRKLPIIVSDVDSTCTPSTSTEKPDCHLYNVDKCKSNESATTGLLRQHSSTGFNQKCIHWREENSKKFFRECLRRHSWTVFQTSDIILQNQEIMSFLRLHRHRLGRSDPNLTTIQIDSSRQISSSLKTSPRTSTTATANTLPLLSCLSHMRPRNLSALNLINLKYALQKQLYPTQETSGAIRSDSKTSDSNFIRRWSLTSVPSSGGYGIVSSSNSHYSSFERLQHRQSYVCACNQQSDANLPHDLQRLESHSLSMTLLDATLSSLPNKAMMTPVQDINTMAYVYKEHYPKAKIQMEERLQNFIDTYKLVDKFDYCSDGSARFIHNQIVELAKDCLEKSTNNLITTLYFNEMNNNLERLLLNAKEKCPQAIGNLETAVRKLLLTTARSARLLECLHFDPEDFLRTLDEVECRAKTITNLKQDIPKYICSKLNLERNPLNLVDELQTTETDTNEEDNLKNTCSSESENQSLTDSNYLAVTSNTRSASAKRSSLTKSPCEEAFEVLKLISNGAYGAVHLVKHRQTQERYAMKKISKTHLILRNQVEQAFVERDIMTFTDNPFVVALVCTFETKNHLCIVMEYAEGGDVATLLKNIGGPLNIDIARMYFAETTLAVEYLHSYGIIHRDLKPDNLLITAIGHIKLTDFGLSKIGLMSLTASFYEKLIDIETKAFNDKQIYGTPSYIAPEVILRQGYGKAVDWWSMGIILYEFLVGIPPFIGNTPDELFANVINGEIDWEQFISDIHDNSSEEIYYRNAKHLIEQLLEHDPSQRLGTLGDAYEIRTHPFCSSINWDSLLREKSDFVPVLESPDDTSYFDTRQDRYRHSDSDNDDDENISMTTSNDSDSLFASFSSVPLRYLSELSGNSKQRHSDQHDSNATLSNDVLRTVSLTNSLDSTNNVHTDSRNAFQDCLTNNSMTNEKVELTATQESFGSDTFLPIPISSDESESSLKKSNPSSSSRSLSQKTTYIDEEKPKTTSTKQYKLRRTSKLFEKQTSIDSSDDIQQEENALRHHRKSRIPRTMSFMKTKQKDVPTSSVLVSNENFPNSSFSYEPLKYNTSQRSISKSFSSSSSSISPSSIWSYNQDDRLSRQTHRHRMTISPLEHDTADQFEQHTSHLSSSNFSPNRSVTNRLRPPIIIHRGPRSFGFTLRTVKVFHGNTDYYTTQHVVVAVRDRAEEAGLRPGDIITHVNDYSVAGLLHSEAVKLILNGSKVLSIRAVPGSQTQIRVGGRRRSPSKQKLYSQSRSEKILSKSNDHYHHSYCLKHRMNSLENNTLNNHGNISNRKHQYNNTSLLRHISEKKVARDMEAAAAAGNILLTVPVTSTNTNPNALTTPDKDMLPSTSLPLLSWKPSINNNSNQQYSSTNYHPNPSERPLSNNEFGSSHSALLPSLVTRTSSNPNSSLIKSSSASNKPIHRTLCKTMSELPIDSRQNNQNQYPSGRNYYDQNYTNRPMIPSYKKKLQRGKSFDIPSSSPPSQSSDYNLNQHVQFNYHNR